MCAILRVVSCLSTLHAVAIAPVFKAEVTTLQIDREHLQSINLMKAEMCRAVCGETGKVESACIKSRFSFIVLMKYL